MKEKQVKYIANQTYSSERALYHLTDAELNSCRFEGPEDGESALKEGRNIKITDSYFALRYPLWHVEKLALIRSEMVETCRAALWYDRNVKIEKSVLNGIKALRECRQIQIADSRIASPEFGWKCSDIKITDSTVVSEYAFLLSHNIKAVRLHFKGKYSFQYVKNITLRNCILDTKDAFWHSQNVTVYDSEINGEYLGWYSDRLTFIRCRIKGTQPLCYCRHLKLIDCTFEDADLAFEYSQVKADIKGHIDSVKNPQKGTIVADSYGEIILNDSVVKNRAHILTR